MWQFIRRGVKGTFERRACITKDVPNFYDVGKCQRLVYGEVERDVGERKWDTGSEFCSNGGCDYRKRKANHRSGKKFDGKATDSFLSAISCSSALVLGWVLTQPYYHWRKWWCDGDKRCLRSCLPILNQWNSECFIYSEKIDLLSLVRKVAESQPITPTVANSLHLCNNSKKSESIEYGPLTAEEALEKAAEEVRMVHESALGALDNTRGVELMERKKHKEGVAYFRRASAKRYAPAAFNLAQCYELGLGTQQDFLKASELYKEAADLGHAGAMYNLAVFYAHGWGGLPADRTRSKELLVKAADLGQPDAMAALGRTAAVPPPPPPPEMDMMEKDDLWSEESASSCDSDDSTHFTSNPDQLYSLARSFEQSSDNSVDPHMVLDLYRLAAESGHKEAKTRLNTLLAYDAIGLLSEHLFGSEEAQKEESFVGEQQRILTNPIPVVM